MEKVQFSDQMLRRASEVTLAQLLDTPFTQPWVISMISNALRTFDEFPETAYSEDIEFVLHQISRKVPHTERMELFRYCTKSVADNRYKRAESQQ